MDAAIDTSDRPFALPADLITIVVDLPFPPSVNRIWRAHAAAGNQVSRSPEYKKWIKVADLLVIANRAYPRRIIRGEFEASIALNAEMGRGGDLDNRVKVVLDWAQSRNCIANDKHCRRLIVEWVAHANAPDGCRLTLREMCA
jgi:Holliday junction resolvase RusA-like endonuclease